MPIDEKTAMVSPMKNKLTVKLRADMSRIGFRKYMNCFWHKPSLLSEPR